MASLVPSSMARSPDRSFLRARARAGRSALPRWVFRSTWSPCFASLGGLQLGGRDGERCILSHREFNGGSEWTNDFSLFFFAGGGGTPGNFPQSENGRAQSQRCSEEHRGPQRPNWEDSLLLRHPSRQFQRVKAWEKTRKTAMCCEVPGFRGLRLRARSRCNQSICQSSREVNLQDVSADVT